VSERKVWLITGAGRGLGVEIAKAALAAGHAVIATGRDATRVAASVGDHDNLLAIKFDVTRPQDAKAAVEAAVARFGRIDILVNNAGNFFAGFFEELSPEQGCGCQSSTRSAGGTARRAPRRRRYFGPSTPASAGRSPASRDMSGTHCSSWLSAN